MGSIILRRGTEITAMGGEIGILACVGIGEVSVYRKPVVGVLSTGDEVVEFDRVEGLRMGEIRDTNRPALGAALSGRSVDCEGYVCLPPRTRDKLILISYSAETLTQTLTTALPIADVLTTTGDVSMGELDLLKPTIQHSLAGTIHFGRVAMKPGKPTTFATISAPSPTSLPKTHLRPPRKPRLGTRNGAYLGLARTKRVCGVYGCEEAFAQGKGSA